MNAMTPFALKSEPISDLTLLDCSQEEIVKDAEHALRRCTTDADLAAWARRWGTPLLERAYEKAV